MPLVSESVRYVTNENLTVARDKHMQIKLRPSTFFRVSGRESLLFCPRNEAAGIVEDAQPVLSQLSLSAKDIDLIFNNAASALNVSPKEIGCDYKPLLDDLVRIGLIEYISTEEDAVVLEQKDNESDHTQGLRDDDFVMDFFRRHNIPAELHIDLTFACNERCVHCYHPNYPNIFLPYSTTEKILREFRDIQGLTVYLSGGECMLHPQFDEICCLCKELGLNIIILTNLTACDEKRIALLQNIAPQFINVSLYSMNAIIHDSITQIKGSWNRTMANFIACENAGLHMRIATPLLKENKDSFKDLKRFSEEHGVHIVPDYTIFPKSDHGTENLCHVCTENELEKVLRSNKEIFESVIFCGHKVSDQSKVCRIGDIRLYVNAKGNYYPCDCMHEYTLGNVEENTLMQVWQCETLQRLRDLRIADFIQCRKCDDRKYCMVCPAFNFISTGNLLIPGLSKCKSAAIVKRVYGGGL